MDIKQVVAIPRSDAVVALFATVNDVRVSLSTKMETLAVALAEQVEDIDLPVSSKVALAEATYAAEFKKLAEDKNVVAQLRACLWAKVSADTMVEVSPPSKDGKVDAVFKRAEDLSPKQAKVTLAQLKTIVAEAEESPEEAARREAAEEKAKHAAQQAANKTATEEAAKRSEEAFAYCLSESQRPHLIAELAKQGYALIKIKTAPKT